MTDTVAPERSRISYMIANPAKENSRISFVMNGRFRSYLMSSAQGQALAELLRAEVQDFEKIGELSDIQTWIAKQTHGRVTVDDCERLRLDGALVDYGLAGRITAIVEQGADFGALCNFVERVAENPDKSVAEDLYRFLEKGNMPLTPEGMILVFKGVDDGYLSYRSGNEDVTVTNADGSTETARGRIPHPVGGEIEMAREDCNPNRDQTCSVGLHGCSFEYLNKFYRNRGKTIICMIDPRDVTAIPNDENDSKLRCCRMKIVDEIPSDDAAKHFQVVVDTRYPAEKPEPETVADEGDLLLTDAVEPEAEERTRIKLHAPLEDEDEAEAEDPSTPAGWSAKGYAEGQEAGAADRKLDYDYQPDLVLPEGIEDDVSRAAYSKAYIEGYDTGYRAEPTLDLDLEPAEATDAEPLDLDEAGAAT